MSKKNKKIEVKGISVAVFQTKDDDYISLTDIAKSKDNNSRAADIIKNWIRNRGTIEFIGTWEKLYNPNFKVVEFDHFKMNAGLPSFVLSPKKWIGKTNPLNEKDLADFITLQKRVATRDYPNTENSWSVNLKDLNQTTFDLSVKNPNTPEKVPLSQPNEVLEAMAILDNKSAATLKNIENLL